MKKEEAQALFILACIEVKSIHELPDGYISTRGRPWWLVETPAGLIKIGWRKRVVSISWENTPIRAIVTDDDTTKDKTMVHAWPTDKGPYVKCLEYLSALGIEIQKHLAAGVSQ